MSWMAWESTNEGEAAFRYCVPGGATVEAGEFTMGVDFSSKTPQKRTLELVAVELAGDP